MIPILTLFLSLLSPSSPAAPAARVVIAPPPPAGLEQSNGEERELEIVVSAGGCHEDTLLPANYTTPFRWSVIAEGDSSIATVKLEYEPPARRPGPPICGAPGQLRVRVAGLHPGETEYVLGYSYLGDPNARPARRVTLRILVTPSR